MISPLWILGPLIRIPIWLACEALGAVYLVAKCAAAIVTAVIKSIWTEIRNRDCEHRG